MAQAGDGGSKSLSSSSNSGRPVNKNSRFPTYVTSQLQLEGVTNAVSKCNFVWEIKKFLSLSKAKDFFVESPIFHGSKATWCLRLYFTKERGDMDTYINVKIIRLESSFLSHVINFDMLVEEPYGFNDFNYGGTIYVGDSNWAHLSSDWIEYSELEDNEYVYLPNGILTLCFAFNIASDISMKKETENSHLIGSKKLSHDLKTLFLSETDSDVTIRVNNRKFPAHRAIIGVRSPVFATWLRNEMKEKESGIVDLQNFDPDVFSDFLYFLYTGYFTTASGKNVFNLYKIADLYDVAELKFRCMESMKYSLSVESFCDIFTLFLQHDEKELLKRAETYFAKNAKEISESDKWQTFLKENPKQSKELLMKVL